MNACNCACQRSAHNRLCTGSSLLKTPLLLKSDIALGGARGLGGHPDRASWPHFGKVCPNLDQAIGAGGFLRKGATGRPGGPTQLKPPPPLGKRPRHMQDAQATQRFGATKLVPGQRDGGTTGQGIWCVPVGSRSQLARQPSARANCTLPATAAPEHPLKGHSHTACSPKAQAGPFTSYWPAADTSPPNQGSPERSL